MTETWLDFCTRRPGPAAKQGYPGVASRTLAEIEGEVKHSMEGTLAGALGELDKLTRMASWTFSIPKVGSPLQHYPLEAIPWHCGLPGDRRQDTSLIGNLTLVGSEHEDAPDNELNANERHWTVEISKAIRRLCPRVAANPPTLKVNLWEHRWLSATSCPSGLIPWDTIIAALKEDDMDRKQFDKWWNENWGAKVGDPPEGQSLPPSHLVLYLRGHKMLQKEVSGAAVKGGEVTKAINAAVKAVQTAGIPDLKVVFPGATIKVPAVTVDVVKK